VATDTCAGANGAHCWKRDVAIKPWVQCRSYMCRLMVHGFDKLSGLP
jgi:hypothetical protein